MSLLEDVRFTVKGLYGHQIGQLEMVLETENPLSVEERKLMSQALARMEQLESAYRSVKQDLESLRKREGKWLESKVDHMVNIVQEMRDIVAEPKKSDEGE